MAPALVNFGLSGSGGLAALALFISSQKSHFSDWLPAFSDAMFTANALSAFRRLTAYNLSFCSSVRQQSTRNAVLDADIYKRRKHSLSVSARLRGGIESLYN